jgi:hypothetical protein
MAFHAAGSKLLRALAAPAAAAAPRPAAGATRALAAGTPAAATGAAAAATGGSGVLRVLGYEVPLKWALGAALVSGVGAYAYLSNRAAQQDRECAHRTVSTVVLQCCFCIALLRALHA